MKHPASLSTLRIGLMAFALALVCACGGGVGSGGTGAPVGVAQGTVNGFGSVIVDGTRFDNRSAPAYAELSPGDLTITEARLGQRVEIGYRQAGVADSLRIDAALSGAGADAHPARGEAGDGIGETPRPEILHRARRTDDDRAGERGAIGALMHALHEVSSHGVDTAAIEAATRALADGTEAFAAARMNAGIQKALAGRRLESL